jgi:protein SFI1
MSRRQTNGPRAASPKLPQSLPNVSSAASHMSAEPNLAPFANLSPEDVNVIDSIILRAGPQATSWIAIVKAYNDVFEGLGKEAADDVEVYTILLKLGLIRASNWGERWSHVKDTLGIASSLTPYGNRPQQLVASSSTGSCSPPAIPLRLQKMEEDMFTLHSRISDSASVIRPRRNPESEPAGPRASTYATRPTTRNGVPKRRPSSLIASANPQPPKVTHPPSQISDDTAPNSVAFTAAKPPSYRTHVHEPDPPIPPKLPVSSSAPNPHPTPSIRPARKTPAPRLAAIRNRDLPSSSHFSNLVVRPQPLLPRKPKKSEEETWRKIELRQKADAHRYEKLVGACFDVWHEGVKWLGVRLFSSIASGLNLVYRSVKKQRPSRGTT